MKSIKSLLFCVIALVFGQLFQERVFGAQEFKLPKPGLTGKMSVEAGMLKKKSVRHFSKEPLTLEQIAQLLWAANGVLPVDAMSGATAKTVPSAGGNLSFRNITAYRKSNGKRITGRSVSVQLI